MGLRHRHRGQSNELVTVDTHRTRVQMVKALLEAIPLESATDSPTHEVKMCTLPEEHRSLAQAAASDFSLQRSLESTITYDIGS